MGKERSGRKKQLSTEHKKVQGETSRNGKREKGGLRPL